MNQFRVAHSAWLSLIPGTLVLVATMWSPPLAAAMGVLLALMVGPIRPWLFLPLLLIAGAFRQLDGILGLQFGWSLIVGVSSGALVRVLLFGWRRSPEIHKPFAWVLGLFSLAGLGSVYLHGGNLFRLVALLSLLAVLGYLLPVLREWSRNVDGEMTRAELAFIVGVTSALVFATALAGFRGSLPTDPASELTLRLGDRSPRALANLFALGVVVSVTASMEHGIGRRYQQALLLLGAVSLGAVVYTGARMPVIAALFGVGCGLVVGSAKGRGLSLRVMRRAVVALCAVAFALTALLTIDPQYLPFIGQSQVEGLRLTGRGLVLAENVRWAIWSGYTSMLTATQWIIGSGPGNFQDLLGASGFGRERYPHSQFIGVLAGFGLLGLGALLSMLIWVGRVAWTAKSAMSFAILAFTALNYSTSGDFDRPDFWISVWLAVLALHLSGVAGGAVRSRLEPSSSTSVDGSSAPQGVG